MLIENIHKEIGHFWEMRSLDEMKKRFFWHDRTKFVKKFIRMCEKCQLAKQSRDMRFSIEEMKSILICKFFYRVTMDPIGPLPKTTNGNKYVLVVINHYSKWCETWLVKEHDACTATKFIEDEVIYRYGVLKYI
jgi:hypothetical protein